MSFSSVKLASKALVTKLDLWHLRHWIFAVLRPDVGPEMKKLRQANFQLVSTGIAALDKYSFFVFSGFKVLNGFRAFVLVEPWRD